jgi:hypothetical protein
MPCNCAKNKNGATKWVFVAADGARKVFNTEVEAKAAKIRAGGGTVQPA